MLSPAPRRDAPLRARRRALALPFVLALALGLFAGAAHAAVTKTETYDVEGEQLSDVWDDIEEKGPSDADGVHAGLAESTVGASFQPDVSCKEVPLTGCEPDDVGTECRATLTASYSLSTEILLPSWTGFDEACEEAQQEWTRFLEKLTEHEEGHDTVVQEALDDAEPKTEFTSAPFQDCDEAVARQQAEEALAALQKELDAELDRLQTKINEANAAYDAETKHGATQGAVLDTSIVCEVEKTPSEQLEEIVDGLDFLDPEELRKALQKKLRNAITSIEKGNKEAAKGQIDAFIKQVKAKRGKPIDPEVADYLIEQAEAAKAGL